MTPATLAARIADYPQEDEHDGRNAVLSITSATEWGTVHDAAGVAALAAVARDAGMTVHMDGARFSNAVAATGASAADLTWRAGVDAISLGGTKNGCLALEAVVFFDPDHARVDLFDEALRHAAASALIGAAGIGEPVAHHPVAGRQRRADGPLQMVRARGVHQQGLGHGRPRLRVRGHNQIADHLRAL